MGLESAASWCCAKKTIIILILVCVWRLAANQSDRNDCSEAGTTCSSCRDNQYGVECLPCECDHFGSLGSCDPVSGVCYCRASVEGKRCNTCGGRGWMGPSITSNQVACLQCFCSGHSSNCAAANNWYKTSVSDYFSAGDDGAGKWRDSKGGTVSWNEGGVLRVVGVDGGVELLFPAKYLGDKRTLFGQQLLLTLRQSPQQHQRNVTMVTVRISTAVNSPYDDGLQLEIPAVAISNQWHTLQVTEQLLVRGEGMATDQQMRRVLTNISSIALSTVGEEMVSLDILTVHMDYATPKLADSDATRVDYVETCQCPPGHEGQFCDKCAPGYAKDPPNGGPFAACVKCYCGNKAVSCDPDTGACQNCTDQTAGDHCEHCRSGYYRNLTSGMCLPCQCPGTPDQLNYFASSCVVTTEQNVTCSCNEGYVGDMCSSCDEGYYGSPLLPGGNCKPCRCHGNTDLLSPTCNTTTGVCNCVHPYVGNQCQLCTDDYYGNAKQQNCTNCDCHPEGTISLTVCNKTTGQCICRDHVTSRRCDQCEDGHWNLSSSGCIPCSCDPIGSTGQSCDHLTGRCFCRHGYMGVACDMCADGYYRHSNGSCIACACRTEASLGCDKKTGQCMCRQGVTGRLCDACEEGTENLWPDCLLCIGDCYNLWNDTISQLTKLVDADTSMASTLNTSTANVTLEELDHLCSIVDDIVAMVNQSNLSLGELNRVDQMVVMVTQQLLPQVKTADAINASIVNINQSEMMLLEQLDMIKQELATSLNELHGLQLELMINSTSNLSHQLEISLNKLLVAYEIITTDVLSALTVISNNSKEYEEKIKEFLSIESELNELLSLVDNVTLFATRISSFLCGESTLLSESNCSGVVQASSTAVSEVLASIVEVSGRLMIEIRVESQLKDLLDMLEFSLRDLNTIGNDELLSRVVTLRDLLLNLTSTLSNKINSSVLLSIESLVNESLQHSLNSTAMEVISLISVINRTISEFPSLTDINDVVNRINQTVNQAVISQQASMEVASDSIGQAMALEKLKQQLTNTTNIKLKINETLQILIMKISEGIDALEDGKMNLQRLSTSLQLLTSAINDVEPRLMSNNEIASLLNSSTTETSNLATDNNQEWKNVKETVNGLESNASDRANKSEVIKNQSEQLLIQIRKLLNDTMDQQATVNELQDQYRQHLLWHRVIEDDVRSVRITLEALIRDIRKVTTINTDCIKSLQGS